MRAILAIFGLLSLAGCAAEAPVVEQPTMYLNMAEPGARLDPQAAASMIRMYRQNNGVGPCYGRSRSYEAGRKAVAGDGEPQQA